MLTWGNLIAICMALYTECKPERHIPGTRPTKRQSHILGQFVNANNEVSTVCVPMSSIRLGGPSVGSKTASTISGHG